MRIFKYKNENGRARLPIGATIIRCDYISKEDGAGKCGHFVWAIVNENENEFEFVKTKMKFTAAPNLAELEIEEEELSEIQLGVCEKQKIKIRGVPVGVETRNGQIYLQYYFGMENMALNEIEIAFFKTGQEIDVDISEYHYIGIAKLKIIQELGLYTFIR